MQEVSGTNRQDRKQCVAGTDVYKRVKLFYPIHKMMATIHSICLQCVGCACVTVSASAACVESEFDAK